MKNISGHSICVSGDANGKLDGLSVSYKVELAEDPRLKDYVYKNLIKNEEIAKLAQALLDACCADVSATEAK